MSRLIILLICFTLAVLVVSVVFFTEYLSIKTIDIESEYLPREEVLRLSGIQIGKNILSISPESLRKTLMEDPRIEAASVEKSYPNRLHIVVYERIPFAVVAMEERMLVLDDTGRVIEIDVHHPELPLIKGFTISQANLGDHITTREAEMFRQALNLVQLLTQTELKAVKIEYHDQQIDMMPVENLLVKFGRAEDIEKQFTNFMALYEKLKFEDSLQGTINAANTESVNYKPFE